MCRQLSFYFGFNQSKVVGEVSTGAGAYDLFLHSQDRAFTEDQLYDWIERDCSLKIASFNEAGLYDPMVNS